MMCGRKLKDIKYQTGVFGNPWGLFRYRTTQRAKAIQLSGSDLQYKNCEVMLLKVKAIKPVFYNGWKHKGDEFECDKKHADKLKKVGKIEFSSKATTTKKKEVK